MVHGVVSLRCPKCARPFLSLPQQQGTMVTCPHCAHSAAMTSYPPASGPLGQGGGVSLPIQRRIIPARPEVTSGSIWPTAPEQPPSHISPQVQSPFPPAPPASSNWPSVMSPPPSPFGVAAPPQQPYVPPLEPVPHMPAFVTPPVGPQGYASPPQPTYQEYEAPASQTLTAVAEPPMRRGMQDFTPAPTWQPPAQKSRVSAVFLILLSLAVVGGTTWYLMQSPLVAEFQAPSEISTSLVNPEPISKSTPTPLAATDEEQKPASLPTVLSPTRTPAANKEPEIRRAEIIAKPTRPEVRLDLVAAAEAAETLLKKLLATDKPKERLSLISESEEHAVDIAEFFERSHPKFVSSKLAATVPKTLPGQESQALISVTTSKNPTQGALLAMVPKPEGGFLLDWPLFAETHERRLAYFLEKPTAVPAWFHAVIRRTHGLELPEAERKLYFCVEVITTADGSAPCVARVKLDSPLGRFLEREMVWEEDYLARLLLQHPPSPDGESAIILDCEGAVTGAVFPSGSR